MAGNRDNSTALISGPRLVKNTLWNIFGQTLPLLAALAAFPPLINGLGTERFGILALAWMVIGYSGLFDLGIGRALTKLLAEKLGTGSDVRELTWTALCLMVVLGLAGTMVIGAASPWLVQDLLKISPEFQVETLNAFYLLALSIPVVITTAGLRGVLEAYQRFDLVNFVRIPMGFFTFLGPLAVLPFSTSLFPIVAVLIVGRLMAWSVHLWLCLRLVPAPRHRMAVRWDFVGPLLSFGSWVTVSSIVGPVMVYFDRFLIGALISMTAVTYYTTPYEVVTKLWVIPGALVGVLFPAFSAILARECGRAAHLFGRGVNYIFLALFPLTLVLVTLAYEGLELWLGVEFAQNSTRVLQFLAFGVFINSLAQVPFALVHSAGRPDLSAKIHLIELPCYLLALWYLLGAYGIQGAAVAWVGRVAVDTVVFFAVARRLLPETTRAVRGTAFIVVPAIGALVLGGFVSGLLTKAAFLLGALLLLAPSAWFLILESGDRTFVRNRLKLIPVFFGTRPE